MKESRVKTYDAVPDVTVEKTVIVLLTGQDVSSGDGWH